MAPIQSSSYMSTCGRAEVARDGLGELSAFGLTLFLVHNQSSDTPVSLVLICFFQRGRFWISFQGMGLCFRLPCAKCDTSFRFP